MIEALVPVDDSENACRAVRHVVALIRGREPMEVHRLNVQVPIESWEVRSHLSDVEVASWHRTPGAEALGWARAFLEEAGITFADRVRVGDVARTIARFAKVRDFDKIVLGMRGMSAIENLVRGPMLPLLLVHVLSPGRTARPCAQAEADARRPLARRDPLSA